MRDKPAMPTPPGTPPERVETEEQTGYLLRKAAAVHRLKIERALEDLNVTAPQFSVLTMLSTYPGSSNAELARYTLLTPPTVTVIVANLLALKAVSRRPHADHGRIQHIDITESGKKLLEQCVQRVSQLEVRIVAGLSDADQALIRRWLNAVATAEDVSTKSSGDSAGAWTGDRPAES